MEVLAIKPSIQVYSEWTIQDFFEETEGPRSLQGDSRMLRLRHLGVGDLLATLLWLFPLPGLGQHRQERGKAGRLVGQPGVGWLVDLVSDSENCRGGISHVWKHVETGLVGGEGHGHPLKARVITRNSDQFAREI